MQVIMLLGIHARCPIIILHLVENNVSMVLHVFGATAGALVIDKLFRVSEILCGGALSCRKWVCRAEMSEQMIQLYGA